MFVFRRRRRRANQTKMDAEFGSQKKVSEPEQTFDNPASDRNMQKPRPPPPPPSSDAPWWQVGVHFLFFKVQMRVGYVVWFYFGQIFGEILQHVFGIAKRRAW